MRGIVSAARKLYQAEIGLSEEQPGSKDDRRPWSRIAGTASPLIVCGIFLQCDTCPHSNERELSEPFGNRGI